MSLVAISGNASGTGTLTIAAPNTNSNYTLTLPTNTGILLSTASNGQVIPKAALPTGSVLQVVQGSYSTQVSSSSATLATTNLTASITPSSATSKVLVIVSSASSYTQAASRQITFAIFRGATNVHGSGQYGAQLFSNGTDIEAPHSMVFLDSPATTSSTTYALYFASTNGGTVNFNQNNNNSYIILMEIAA
jgi:hypothetical protein